MNYKRLPNHGAIICVEIAGVFHYRMKDLADYFRQHGHAIRNESTYAKIFFELYGDKAAHKKNDHRGHVPRGWYIAKSVVRDFFEMFGDIRVKRAVEARVFGGIAKASQKMPVIMPSVEPVIEAFADDLDELECLVPADAAGMASFEVALNL